LAYAGRLHARQPVARRRSLCDRAKPAASQAPNPPTTSPTWVRAELWSEAAARLEDSPCSQIRISRVASEPACGLRQALSGASRH